MVSWEVIMSVPPDTSLAREHDMSGGANVLGVGSAGIDDEDELRELIVVLVDADDEPEAIKTAVARYSGVGGLDGRIKRVRWQDCESEHPEAS